MLLLATLFVAQADLELLDRIVAVVNDDVITLSELNQAAQPFLAENATDERRKKLHEDVLDQMIAERLLTQQVKEANLTVTEDEVNRAITDILRQNKITEDELKQAIESRGMAMSQYREDLKAQLVRLKIVDMKVRSRIQITESEIKAEYERVSRDQTREELVHIRHIFLRWGESPDPAEKERVLAQAKAAKERILAGAVFADVAKELSQGPTAAQGGDLGTMEKKSLLPELARGIAKLKAGEISAPIETQSGVHVVLVEERKLKEGPAYTQVRDQIYQQLYQQTVERQMKIWLEELRAESAVEIRL